MTSDPFGPASFWLTALVLSKPSWFPKMCPVQARRVLISLVLLSNRPNWRRNQVLQPLELCLQIGDLHSGRQQFEPRDLRLQIGNCPERYADLSLRHACMSRQHLTRVVVLDESRLGQELRPRRAHSVSRRPLKILLHRHGRQLQVLGRWPREQRRRMQFQLTLQRNTANLLLLLLLLLLLALSLDDVQLAFGPLHEGDHATGLLWRHPIDVSLRACDRPQAAEQGIILVCAHVLLCESRANALLPIFLHLGGLLRPLADEAFLPSFPHGNAPSAGKRV